jgi:hypothetical protein
MSSTYTFGLATPTAHAGNIASQTISTTKYFAGTEIDNSANLDPLADLEVSYSFGTNPTAGTTLQFYIVYKLGGTTSEDGIPSTNDGTSTPTYVPPATSMVDAVSVTADTGTHDIILRDIPLLPYKMRLLVFNNGTGQTVTMTVNFNTKKLQTIGP